MNKTQGTDVAFWARKKRERRRMSLPQKIFLTGTEGKRSFPQSSFAFFSFKKRKWERRRTSLPQKIFLTGAEGKRSFPQSSLPSFLSRKESGSDAERHSHKKSSLRAQKGNEVSRKVLCQAFFQEKKVGATQNVTPTKNLPYGRRGETKFPAKFFAKLSFKKAWGSFAQTPGAPGGSGGS